MTDEIVKETVVEASAPMPPDPAEVTTPSDAAPAAKTAEETRPGEVCATEPTAASDASDAPVDYAALAAEDLLELKRQFPELYALDDLTELEDPARYGALRDLGLSAKEAYLATTTPRRVARGDNRAHLHSAVPKAVQATGDGMSEGELSAARELFFGLGDAELHRLYQKVTK